MKLLNKNILIYFGKSNLVMRVVCPVQGLKQRKIVDIEVAHRVNKIVRASHSTMMEYLIRRAEVADAPGACEAVRQSIAELCIEDHHGDQATIAAWLSNKTIENMASWIASPRDIAAVAQASIGIVGFGLLSQSGAMLISGVWSEKKEGRILLDKAKHQLRNTP